MENLNEKAHIFGSIFMLANRLQIIGDKFDRNITIKQWQLIAAITKSSSKSPTISEVAAFIGNSRQNVKKMALILEREGFLKLEKDSADARILRISLTVKCEDYFSKRQSRETEFLEKLFKGIDTHLIKCMDSGISKLEDNINEMEKCYE